MIWNRVLQLLGVEVQHSVIITRWMLIQFCPTLCDLVNYRPPGSSVHGDYPSKNTGEGCHTLLQGIFPTQGLNPGLLHFWQILYCLKGEHDCFLAMGILESASRGLWWFWLLQEACVILILWTKVREQSFSKIIWGHYHCAAQWNTADFGRKDRRGKLKVFLKQVWTKDCWTGHSLESVL